MNLTEEKKKPLRARPLLIKKEMLQMHYKQSNFASAKSRFVSPSDYVNYLQDFNELSNAKLYNCIESLRIALTNNPVSWVKEFGENQGLACILAVLNNCYKAKHHQMYKIQLECIKCLKAVMNNTVSFWHFSMSLDTL